MKKPLADLIRPQNISEIIGQDHILNENGLIGQMIKSQNIQNLILWGPPGTGKTTIAKALSNSIEMNFISLSAIFTSTLEIKKIIENIKDNTKPNVLFIDEIHRFNKTQQDILLPYIEDGTVIFIGATTENPSFNINNALLSRCHTVVLNSIKEKDLITIINKIEKIYNKSFNDDIKIYLSKIVDGDVRTLLNNLEILINSDLEITLENVINILQKKQPLSDKNTDIHYNLISALHKSLRASDTDASLYWTARMMIANFDVKYIFRRLTRFAIEDIGLSDPNAMDISINAWQIYERLGSPEGDLALTELVIYLATAPKSVSNYKAKKIAYEIAEKTRNLMPPKNILNAPTKLMKNLGYNKNYIYEPDTKYGFSGQNCFPEELGKQKIYTPKEIGFEREIKKRLDYWDKLREKIKSEE